MEQVTAVAMALTRMVQEVRMVQEQEPIRMAQATAEAMAVTRMEQEARVVQVPTRMVQVTAEATALTRTVQEAKMVREQEPTRMAQEEKRIRTVLQVVALEPIRTVVEVRMEQALIRTVQEHPGAAVRVRIKTVPAHVATVLPTRAIQEASHPVRAKAEKVQVVHQAEQTEMEQDPAQEAEQVVEVDQELVAVQEQAVAQAQEPDLAVAVQEPGADSN